MSGSPENSGKRGRKVPEGRRFKPGVSGNPGGRPKSRLITEIFEELFADPATREAIKEQILWTLTHQGMAGVLLLKEMAERLEGKVKEQVEHSGSISIFDQLQEALKRMETSDDAYSINGGRPQ